MLIIERKDGSLYVRASSMLIKFSAEESRLKHEYRFNVTAPAVKHAVPGKFEMYKLDTSKVQKAGNCSEIGENLMFVNTKRAAS